MATVPMTPGATGRRARLMQEGDAPGVQAGHRAQLPVLDPRLPLTSYLISLDMSPCFVINFFISELQGQIMVGVVVWVW